MASKTDPAVSRKILEIVREKGGIVTVTNMQEFKRIVGVTCSMNVFKTELNHLSGPTGKLTVSKPGRHDPHALEDDQLIIRLKKHQPA